MLTPWKHFIFKKKEVFKFQENEKWNGGFPRQFGIYVLRLIPSFKARACFFFFFNSGWLWNR